MAWSVPLFADDRLYLSHCELTNLTDLHEILRTSIDWLDQSKDSGMNEGILPVNADMYWSCVAPGVLAFGLRRNVGRASSIARWLLRAASLALTSSNSKVDTTYISRGGSIVLISFCVLLIRPAVCG